MTVSPIHLSNYLLRIAFRDDAPLNAMKLQRLLYLTAAGYARETGGDRLFSEDFVTWATGPVLPSVHAKFGCYRANRIRAYGRDACGHASSVRPGRTLRHVLADVEAVFMPQSARELTRLVRADGTAWCAAFRDGRETLRHEDLATDPSWDIATRD